MKINIRPRFNENIRKGARNTGISMSLIFKYIWLCIDNPGTIFDVKDTITLDKTLDELKQYWHKHYNF